MSFSIRRSLQTVLALLAVVALAGIVVDIFSIRRLTQEVNHLSTQSIRPLLALKGVSDVYAVTIVDTVHKVSHGSLTFPEGAKLLGESRGIIDKHWSAFKSHDMEADDQVLASRYEEQMKIVGTLLQALENAMHSKDKAALDALTDTQLYQKIDPLTEIVEKLFVAQTKDAEENLARAVDLGKQVQMLQAIIVPLILLIAVAGFWLVNGQVVRPISTLQDAMTKLAEGQAQVELPKAGERTEIGAMTKAVEIFRENTLERRRLEAVARSERDREIQRQQKVETVIQEFRSSIGGIRSVLDQELVSMQNASTNLTTIAKGAAEGANAADEASREASSNVSVVAGAAGELTSASREISTQVHAAGTCVTQAMDVARDADKDVSSLAELAGRIGAIVDIINAIAEQTNMLALNATIEAARAGEAGRSFAVVAAEVKTLAGQTAKATQEISDQVSAIQGATHQAVESIRTITTQVSEIQSRTMAIAAAVEQQEASTHEISKSIGLASGGSERVAKNVAHVSGAVERTNTEANRLLSTSAQLTDVAGQLSRSVEDFLQDVTQDVVDRRQAIRYSSRQAVVVDAQGRRTPTVVVDISQSGAKIDAVSTLEVGHPLVLEWQSGEKTRCRAVWVRDGKAGLAFDVAISEEFLRLAA